MGIREGLMLREYMDTNAQKMETSKLQAQLYGSQAKHYDAQNKLLDIEMGKHQAFVQLQQQRAADALRPMDAPALPAPQTMPSGQLDLPTPGMQAPGFEAQPPLPMPRPAQPRTPTPADNGLKGMMEDAWKAGLFDVHAKLQHGAIEQQKIDATQRVQDLQDQLGVLRSIEGNIVRDPLKPEEYTRKMQMVRHAIAAAQDRLGKTKEAADTLEGKITALQPGADLTRQYPGEPSAEVLRTNPNRPIVTGPEGQGWQPPATPGGLATPITPAPVSAFDRARQKGGGAEAGRQDILSAPAGDAAAPTAELLTQLTTQLTTAGATPEEAARMAPIVLKAMAPVSEGAAGGVPGETVGARRVRLAEVAKRGATPLPRETAEQIGVPVGTTYGQLPGFGSTGTITPEEAIPRQLPSAKERDELSDMDTTIQISNDLLKQMQTDPKAAGLLGSFLFDPKAALTRTLARRGGKATPEEREFLAMLGVNSAMLRTKLIGLAQTSREMSGLIDFLPGPETSAEEIQSSLQAIVKYTTVQRDKKLAVQKGLGIRTPSTVRTDKTPPSQTPAQAETPREQANRMLREQGLPPLPERAP